MSTLTNGQALAIALVPGLAEALKRAANGSMAWDGMALGVQNSRNLLYVAVALAAIGMIGAASSGGVAFTITVIVGTGLALVASKMLYSATKMVQDHWDSRPQVVSKSCSAKSGK